MAVAGGVTIAGGTAPVNVAFTVTGTATLGYARQFSSVVDAGLSNGSLVVTSLTSTGGGAAAPLLGAAGAGSRGLTTAPLYVPAGANQTISIPAGGGYFFDSVGGALTVEGSSGGGDTVLGGPFINSNLTFVAEGGNNQIIFTGSNDLYDGSANTVGGDTVVAGSGKDTIKTGIGQTTVYAGSGNAAIYLNDTGSNFNTLTNQLIVNDKVWIHDGQSTIYANGTSDVVGIDAPQGQLIFGGSNPSQILNILLGATDPLHTQGQSLGNNTIVAGAGRTGVFLGSSDNTIFGGSGFLTVVAGQNVTDTVVAGTADTTIYGNSGVNFVLANNPSDIAFVQYVAGQGSENYYGGNATTDQQIFGYNPGTGANAVTLSQAINETLVGGAGNDTLVSAAGNETLYGGGGSNTFVISDPNSTGAGLTANIVLADFGTGNNVVQFDAATFTSASDLNAAIQGGTQGTITLGGTTYNDFQVTFQDGTQVTFVGITSAAELTNKIVS